MGNVYYGDIPLCSTEELSHYGILGMKWGVRRTPEQLGHKTVSYNKVERLAKKDAKEYARAKMYYGEGAGTRRKLIRNKVNERSKNEHYKSSFEKYLNEQDMADHANKAKLERKSRDAISGTKRTANKILQILTGPGMYASASVIALYALGQATGVTQEINKWGMEKANDAVAWVKNVLGNMKGGFGI